MGRIAKHPWKQYLTTDERSEIKKIDLKIKEMSDKLSSIKRDKNLIQSRASRRAARDDDFQKDGRTE